MEFLNAKECEFYIKDRKNNNEKFSKSCFTCCTSCSIHSIVSFKCTQTGTFGIHLIDQNYFYNAVENICNQPGLNPLLPSPTPFFLSTKNLDSKPSIDVNLHQIHGT